MNQTDHVADLAELYALGALEPDERARVDAHLVVCPDCERAVGRAEETVAALDDLVLPQAASPARLGERIAAAARTIVPQRPVASASQGSRAGRRRRWASLSWQSWSAVAASVAFILGIGGGVWLDRTNQTRLGAAGDERALERIATSHFRHASFIGREAGAPVAKVLYARDGAWIYVVVDARDCACRVVAHSENGTHDLGPLHEHGATKTLFNDGAGRPVTLELMRGGQRVADATLIY